MRTPVELPESARAKLSEIEMQRDASLDASRSGISRLNQLPPDADQGLRQRLASENARHAERHRVLSMIVSHINQFLMESRGVALEPVQTNVMAKSGETVSAAVEAARSEIRTLRQRLAVVKAAPLPAADQMELAEEFVARRARMARPKIAVQQDALRVHWADDVIMSKSDVLNLLCFFLPGPVLAALQGVIGEPSPSNALPAAERDQQLARIEQRLFELEREEEGLIMKAHADGIDVLRSGDASPACVLGVVVKAKTQAVA